MARRNNTKPSNASNTYYVLPERGPVEALIYWRDVKLSGIVFGSILVTLLSLSYFSFITVAANIGLGVLGSALSFRIYKDILQAVQKTPQSHPLQQWLDLDISLPKEKASELLDVVLTHVNASLVELRRLLLVQDLVDSLKFGVVLWSLTYVGAWFNGLTLVLIAFVGLFTLPKVYENNKQEIDQYYQLGYGKLLDITNKVNDILPGALKKRAPEKKE